MFYYLDVLQRRGQFGLAWVAAFDRADFQKRRIVALVKSYNVEKCCDDVLRYSAEGRENCPRMNLYVTSTLLAGLCKVFRRKSELLFDDAARVFVKWGEVARLLFIVDIKDKKRLRYLQVRAIEGGMTREICSSEQPPKKRKKRRENEDEVPPLTYEELAQLLHQADAVRVSNLAEITLEEEPAQPVRTDREGFGGVESMLPELQDIINGVESRVIPQRPPAEASTAVITGPQLSGIESVLPEVQDMIGVETTAVRGAPPAEEPAAVMAEDPRISGIGSALPKVQDIIGVEAKEVPAAPLAEEPTAITAEQPQVGGIESVLPEVQDLIGVETMAVPAAPTAEEPTTVMAEQSQAIPEEVREAPLPAAGEVVAELRPRRPPPRDIRRTRVQQKLKKDDRLAVRKRHSERIAASTVMELMGWWKQINGIEEKDVHLCDTLTSFPVPNDPPPALPILLELIPWMEDVEMEPDAARRQLGVSGDLSAQRTPLPGVITPEIENMRRPRVSSSSFTHEAGVLHEGIPTIPEVAMLPEAGELLEERPREIMQLEEPSEKRTKEELPDLALPDLASTTTVEAGVPHEGIQAIPEEPLLQEAGELEKRRHEVMQVQEPSRKRRREEPSDVTSSDMSSASAREANVLSMVETAWAECDGVVTFAMLAPPRSTSKRNAARLITVLLNLEAKRMVRTQQNEPFGDIHIIPNP
ncbi:titin-like isoform X2 [Ischnura elegans]|uniref:titin-like isoform X2 n=1 Tax=Ischnura elegans TaxID=197161 RepID=UPI001ED8730B|nr:titin-like isoform X2 [Ischnura elegans]